MPLVLYNFVLFITVVIVYTYAPSHYDYGFCQVVFWLFIFQSIPSTKVLSGGNIISFYTLFTFSYGLINYLYPCFLYILDPEFFSMFTISFDKTYISKGTALATLGASSFFFGASLWKPRSRDRKFRHGSEYLDFKLVSILAFILFILFVLTVGRDFLAGSFTTRSTFSMYLLQLLTCFISLAAIVFYRYFHQQKTRWLIYILLGSYIMLFLKVGDRGPALSSILLCLGLYSTYVRRIPKLLIFSAGSLGIILMHLIGVGRSTVVEKDGLNAVTRGIKNVSDSNDSNIFVEATSSFVVNARNLYVSMDVVDDNGANLGTTSVLPATLGIFPFAQSAYEEITGIELETSGQFFTHLAFGSTPSSGLGTNLVADVYLSFGRYGVLILFFILGMLVESLKRSALEGQSFFAVIVYFLFLSNAIYWPRSGYFTMTKFILWTLLLYLLLRATRFLVFRPVAAMYRNKTSINS